MKKPTVYLDTTIFSAYWYRPTDAHSHLCRSATREWWMLERDHFKVFASQAVLHELEDGHYQWQKPSVAFAKRIAFLPISNQVRDLRHYLVEKKVVPPGETGDALHLAIAAINGIDYLLTWNYAHLANPHAQRKLTVVLESRRLGVPLLVTPESIPQVRFGQNVRRR